MTAVWTNLTRAETLRTLKNTFYSSTSLLENWSTFTEEIYHHFQLQQQHQQQEQVKKKMQKIMKTRNVWGVRDQQHHPQQQADIAVYKKIIFQKRRLCCKSTEPASLVDNN